MFLINNEPLTQKSHPDHFKWLDERKKEVRSENKKVYHFSAFIRKSKVQDENGRMIDADQKRMVSLVSTFTDPKNELNSFDEWAYVTNLSSCKFDNGIYKPLNKTRMLSYNTVFDVNQDIELIVYFKYITRNKNIREVDYAKISKEKAEKEALESQTKWYIFNPKSPIHPDSAGTEDALRNIAMSWKVSGADEKDIYTVMNELWDTVKMMDSLKESGRGFDTFCKEVSSKGDTNKRATVLLAIKKGVLEYGDNQWRLNQRGGGSIMVCGVPPGKESYKEERVIEYVVSDDYYYDEVAIALEGGDPFRDELKIKKTREELITDVVKLNLGWEEGKLWKMKNDKLSEIIEKKLTPDTE